MVKRRNTRYRDFSYEKIGCCWQTTASQKQYFQKQPSAVMDQFWIVSHNASHISFKPNTPPPQPPTSHFYVVQSINLLNHHNLLKELLYNL